MPQQTDHATAREGAMSEQANRTSGAGGVQVFELTMDSLEDQDELNRRLRKPGEPDPGPPPNIGRTAHSESTAASTGKKKGKRKGTP
jgi:hypothetical protein